MSMAVVSGVSDHPPSTMNRPAREYIQSRAQEDPQRYSVLAELYEKRLWHQLTQQLVRGCDMSVGVRGGRCGGGGVSAVGAGGQGAGGVERGRAHHVPVGGGVFVVASGHRGGRDRGQGATAAGGRVAGRGRQCGSVAVGVGCGSGGAARQGHFQFRRGAATRGGALADAPRRASVAVSDAAGILRGRHPGLSAPVPRTRRPHATIPRPGVECRAADAQDHPAAADAARHARRRAAAAPDFFRDGRARVSGVGRRDGACGHGGLLQGAGTRLDRPGRPHHHHHPAAAAGDGSGGRGGDGPPTGRMGTERRPGAAVRGDGRR
eukprot:ctg_1623.g521